MLSRWLLVFAALVVPQPLRIVVNIPAYRLDAFVNDSLVRSLPIAPGMPRYKTPRGSYAITRIDWNPWWIPPKSGWAAKEKPTPPGPTNPMGRVKLNFEPLYFLHGSPFEGSIGTAASHGCVRLRNGDAIDLARLVHKYGTPELTPEEVEGFVADTTTTREIDLTVRVPVELRYDLVEIREGNVSVYRDVYGLATRSLRTEAYAALMANGVDSLDVDDAKVRAFVRSVPRAGRTVPIDSLLRVERVVRHPTPSGASPRQTGPSAPCSVTADSI